MFPIDFYRTGNIYENSSVSPLMAMKKYRFKTVQFGSLFTIYIRVLYTSFVLGDWHGCALVQHRALEDNICQILYILCPFFFFFFLLLEFIHLHVCECVTEIFIHIKAPSNHLRVLGLPLVRLSASACDDFIIPFPTKSLGDRTGSFFLSFHMNFE